MAVEIVLEGRAGALGVPGPVLSPSKTRELGQDVRMLVDHAFDLIEAGVSANLLTLRTGVAP